MGTRRVAFAETLALVWVMAILSGCQRQESPQPAVVEPETQAEATGAAWVDARRIANADTEPHNWLAHGRTWSEQRYSPLNDINESNVSELGLAWYFDLDTTRGQIEIPVLYPRNNPRHRHMHRNLVLHQRRDWQSMARKGGGLAVISCDAPTALLENIN